MTSELDRGISPAEATISPEAERMLEFYDAYKFLEFHPIFNTTPGETMDLTIDPLGISSGMGLDLSDESLKETPVNTYNFERSLEVMVVKINPETGEIDDDKTKNTKVAIWLEAGPWDPDIYRGTLSDDEISEIPEDKRGGFTHDPNLDCGGDTFEDAVIKLAKLVKIHYPPLLITHNYSRTGNNDAN